MCVSFFPTSTTARQFFLLWKLAFLWFDSSYCSVIIIRSALKHWFLGVLQQRAAISGVHLIYPVKINSVHPSAKQKNNRSHLESLTQTGELLPEAVVERC